MCCMSSIWDSAVSFMLVNVFLKMRKHTNPITIYSSFFQTHFLPTYPLSISKEKNLFLATKGREFSEPACEALSIRKTTPSGLF